MWKNSVSLVFWRFYNGETLFPAKNVILNLNRAWERVYKLMISIRILY